MATKTLDKSIEVDCSQHAVFDKLSRVETYVQFRPRFTGAQEVQARGAHAVHIVEVVEGRREEFDIELDPVPESRIDYRIRGRAPMAGALTLRQLDDRRTELRLHAEYDPQNLRDAYQLSEEDVDQHLQQRLEAMKSLAEDQVSTDPSD